MQVSKGAVVLRKWREHRARVQEMKDKCWLVLSHPDSTPEQLQVIRQVALSTQAESDKVRKVLLANGFNAE